MKRNLLIYLLCTFAAIAFSSCMKKPDHTPDFGPEASIDEINASLKIDMPMMPETIAFGQTSSLDWYQVVDTRDPITFYQRADKVTAFADLTTASGDSRYCWEFTVKADQRDDSGMWKTSIDKFGPLAYPSSDTTDCSGMAPNVVSLNKLLTFQIRADIGLKPLTLTDLKQSDSTKTVKTTYHKLKREDTMIPVPQAVAANPNWCGTNPDRGGKTRACKKELRIVRLSFDRVEWPDNEKPFKVSYKMSFSSDVPTYISDWNVGSLILSNQIESCYQFWKEFKNGEVTQNVPIRVCKELVSFQFGQQKALDSDSKQFLSLILKI